MENDDDSNSWHRKKLMRIYCLLILISWFHNSFNFNAFYGRLNLMYMDRAYACSIKRHFIVFIISICVKYIEGKEKHSDRTSDVSTKIQR